MRATLSIAILLMSLTPAVAAASTPASTQPSTQPAIFSITGQVKISAGLNPATTDLSRVVVYLDTDPKLDTFPIPTTRPAVAQKNKEFIPKFLVVPKGIEVEFPNWDHISHNVFSRSAAAPAFDLDRYPYGVSKTRQFTKVGIVQVFCNIHPSMRAMIFVTPNVFFTRARKDGRFTLPGIPAGQYTLAAWQDRCGTQRQTIDVAAGMDTPVSFTLTEDRNTILSNNPPKHGEGYGIERGLGIKQETLNLPVVQESHPAPPCPDCK